MPDARDSLRARWILPVDGEPIENGTIEIEQGRISALHAAHVPKSTDLGNVAIIPGLINTHTHLEFSQLRAPLQPAHPFASWIRTLVAERRKRGSGAPADAAVKSIIELGLQESTAAGTTTVGEIATADIAGDTFTSLGPRGVVFREVIARFSEHFDAQLEVIRRHLERWRTTERRDIIAGISPHAPYSVHPDLLRQLVDLAREFDAPVAMHVAETPDELELLDRGTGELRRMLEDFGVWRDGIMPAGIRPLDSLRELDRLPRALVVHGNYLDEDELDLIARRPQLTVVYCPRTHWYFGHTDHPWQKLLDRGGRVALGTDSRASNPDLSLWNELLFLRRTFSNVPLRRLLELGTIAGARALGLDDEIGSLTVGKSADIAVVCLGIGSETDGYRALFHDENTIIATMRAGKWLSGRVDVTRGSM